MVERIQNQRIFQKAVYWLDEFPVLIILKMYSYIWAAKKPFTEEAHWTYLNRMTLEHVTFLTAAGLRIHIGKPDLTDSEVQLNCISTLTLWAWTRLPVGWGGAVCVSGGSLIRAVGSQAPSLLCSQEPGHCHSRGLGQSGQQPLPQVPQPRAENRHELAADGPQCCPQRLCPGRFQGLPEHHRETAGNAQRWWKRPVTWPEAAPHTEGLPWAREKSRVGPRGISMWWVGSQMQICVLGQESKAPRDPKILPTKSWSSEVVHGFTNLFFKNSLVTY